jgi:hypothetical protein
VPSPAASFPDMEVPSFWMEAGKELRFTYTIRMLEHFASFFGLVRLEHSGAKLYSPDFIVTAEPLLYEAVRFHVWYAKECLPHATRRSTTRPGYDYDKLAG